ncbi:MAG: hypothetical protein NTW86_07785 [Candidatus Sumerlaeota bacterium]|nr:hypothetical protein [Candidatus Sumerlaeota bacterium]
MESVMAWLTHLNSNHSLGYAILTVTTMSGLGLVVGGLIEFIFWALGIRYGKIDIEP